jgi:release factor glutamine methyltransferase
LFVEPGVFIPRPETEILVDVVINTIHDSQPTIHDPLILDLCTGSGNVAIALTKTLTNCKIISSDISGKALLLVKKNALLNGVSERIEFIKADLFKIQDIYRGSFDIIVSNPPYISSEKLAGLPDEVKMEPKEALNGGTGGLDFYKRIIKESPEFLKKKGFLALELDDTISDSVKKLFLATDTFRGVKVYKDLSSIDRVIVAQRR